MTKSIDQGSQSTRRPPWKAVISGVLLGLGAIIFFLAQSTLWVSTTVFNENNFVKVVENTLSTEESRQAIARTIVDAALENNPVANQLVGKQATALVSGLLETELVGQVFDRLAHRTYAYITSPNRQDIAIDLTTVKDPLTAIIGIVEQTGREVNFDPSAIPDSITVVESDSLPDVSGYIRTILVANALLWLATIASFATYVFLNRRRIVRSVYLVGAVVIIASLVGLLIGPFVPPVISSFVNLISIRGVIEDLSSALLYRFQVQLLSGIVIASAIMVLVSLRGAIKTGAERLVALVR